MEVIPHTCLWMRPLQLWFLLNFNPALHHQNKPLTMTKRALHSLLWWETPANLLGGSPFFPPPPSVTVTTDASLWGWGAHIGTDCVRDPWPLALTKKHINYLELPAIYWALMSFSHLWGRTVQIPSDNTTAIASLNCQGGTVSRSLCQLALSLWDFCIHSLIHLVVLHLPGELNTTAGALSRGYSSFHKMEINWTYLSQVFARWGTPVVDIFATQQNMKCNAFCC